MKLHLFVLCLIATLLTSCKIEDRFALTKVHITNQKGFIETITNKERLKEFDDEAAMEHQPHKKVVRVYRKGQENRMVITTYHSNGHISQLLESTGNKAYGNYKEWHPNGRLKIQAFVIKGIPDIDISGQNSWSFDGKCEAFDEDGNLSASFNYENGFLEKESIVFHSSGEIKERRIFLKNLPHGVFEMFDKDGTLLEKTNYEMGQKTGYSYKYWKKNRPASEEKYENGLLVSGVYFNPLGKLLTQIKKGCGKRVIFQEEGSYELHEYMDGMPNGLVQIFDKKGFLVNSFHNKNDIKNGLELVYFSESDQKKLSIEWTNGKIHGKVKTWYLNGNLESEKEMSLNKKQGISTAWYQDGNLMLIEEYDSNQLIKGKYFERGKTIPISTINNGKGVVTLFDEKGIFIKKIDYYAGKPVE